MKIDTLFSVAGKVVLVTGGSRGLGLGIAGAIGGSDDDVAGEPLEVLEPGPDAAAKHSTSANFARLRRSISATYP